MKKYDVIICGGGPSGMTAGIYATRGGLSAVIIEKAFAGGQIVNTYEIENYPGIKKLSGPELAMQMQEHAEELGVEFVYDEITAIDVDKKVVTLQSGETVEGKKIILSMGATKRNIGIPSELTFQGRGVAYCATCDGAFYKDKIVAVMGGGNTAVEDALYLTKFAKKVYLIHRRDELRAVGVLVDTLLKSNVEIIWSSVITEIKGEGKVGSMIVESVKTGEKREIAVDGIFVAIGQVPQTQLVEKGVALTDDKYIIVDHNMKTNVPGVFACGDITKKELRQVITACSDGAIAADSAIKELM